MPRQSKVEHNLTRVRDALGLTRPQMASRLRISKSTLEGYEKPGRGDGRVLTEEAARAAESAFGVSAECLLQNDLSAPLVTPDGDAWHPGMAKQKIPTAWESAEAEYNATAMSAILFAIFESAAQRGQARVLGHRVQTMIDELANRFGICDETLKKYQKALDASRAKRDEEFDKLESKYVEDFKQSRIYKALNEKGIQITLTSSSGSDSQRIGIRMKPGMMRECLDSETHTAAVPAEYWEKKGMLKPESAQRVTFEFRHDFFTGRTTLDAGQVSDPDAPPPKPRRNPRRKTSSRS